jgi:PAS domain S-box-containing protein
MNTAQVLGYPLLLISALELFLGFLLLKQNPRNSLANKATAACAFAAALWSLSSSLMYIRLSLGLDYLLFQRACWVGWFTVPTALQTVFFLQDERSRKARIAGMVLYPFWTVVLALCLFTDLIVTPGFIPLPYSNSPGPLEMPLRLVGSMMAFWLIYEIAKLRRQVTGYRRAQLSYYLYGTAIFGTGGAVIAGLLQLFTGRALEPSLSAYFSLPWVLMIFYAITRHRLFDIRFLISRTLIILTLSFCISAFQFVLFKVLEPVIGPVATIFISVPVIGVIFFGTPLSRNVQHWINDLVLGGRYQYQKMLKESANAMVTILDRDELLLFIVETVRSGLGVREVFLYLQGLDGSYSVRHCPKANRETADGCVLPDNVVAGLIDTGQPIISEELAIGPSGVDTGLRETVRRMGAEIILPLISKGRLLGALTLNERSNGEPYLQGDIDALQTLTGQAAVAIENTRLFEEAVQARASLKESEDIFRTLADTSNAAILIFRPHEVIYANPALSRMSGYAIHELQAMNPFALVHPDFRETMIQRGEARLRGEETPSQYEFKYVHRDGSERWAITNSATLLLRGGPALLSTMVEITDLKRAEEAKLHFFKESEKHYQEKIAEQERFSAILQVTSDGFWIVNEEDRIIFTNDAYCRMSGYTREELTSMTIADLEAQESPEVVKHHTDSIRQKGHDRFETRHRRKDGSLLDLEVSVNRYKDEKTVFSFLRDITDRKKAEAERARMFAEKEKILKDLHDGIGGITTNINLLAELAQKQQDRSAVKRSLSTIADLSRESLSEIRSFIQSLDARELTWQAVAAEFRSIGSTIIEPHGVRFSLVVSAPEGGPAPSSSVAMNLFRIYKESLSNIIKHAKATAVDVLFSVESGRVSLEVRDNGIGLNGKRASGRGLMNMKNRALEMGGDLVVTTDNGTRLRLEFPIP